MKKRVVYVQNESEQNLTMTSLGVWCTVSKHEYPLLFYTMKNLLEHQAVCAVVIVHTGHEPSPEFGALRSKYHKVQEFHHDFGEGFTVSLEEGGYDQKSARNFAIELIENTNVEWIFQFDADEYATSELISTVVSLDRRYDMVLTSYYTLLSKTHYWYKSNFEKIFFGMVLFHPHPRIWRTSLKKRCELCPKSIQLYPNKTRHASVSFEHHPHWHIFPVNSWEYFHLHCILGKRHTFYRTSSKEIPTVLPSPLIECIDKLNSSKIIVKGLMP
jgi:hypothetical protein